MVVVFFMTLVQEGGLNGSRLEHDCANLYSAKSALREPDFT